MPSDCTDCWKPCFNKVDDTQVRCSECERLLASHPLEKVRLALVHEETVSHEVLTLFASDSSVAVALTANERLSAMQTIPAKNMVVTNSGWDGWGDGGVEDPAIEDNDSWKRPVGATAATSIDDEGW